MVIAEELVAGVASSVLAVLLVEIYLGLRRRFRQRSLRWLVGTETCAVVTPVAPGSDHPAGLLTTYDAIGLAHVLEACNRANAVPVIARNGELAENSPLDVIALGGPTSNQVAATFLKAYCPGFEILKDPVSGKVSYRCGIRTFEPSDDEMFAFIVRLTPKTTGLPGTALLAWGQSSVATASAGYYVAQYASALRKVNKGSFFVAISVRWVLGYRSFDTRPIDLSAAAFAEPKRVAGLTPTPAPAPAPPPPTPVAETVLAGSSTPRTNRRSGRSRVAEALDTVRGPDETPAASKSPSTAPAVPPADSEGEPKPSSS